MTMRLRSEIVSLCAVLLLGCPGPDEGGTGGGSGGGRAGGSGGSTGGGSAGGGTGGGATAGGSGGGTDGGTGGGSVFADGGVGATNITWEWLSPLPQGNPLRSVWAVSASEAFAVGEGGVIAHTTSSGVSWTIEASGTFRGLYAVWASSASDVYAVGEGGIILHSSGGGTWAPQSSGTSASLFAIWGSGASSVFAAGNSGTILHSGGGGTWAAQTSGVTDGIGALTGSGSDVYAATGPGGVLRSTNAGATWASVAAPFSGFPASGLWAAGAELWAVAGPLIKRSTDNGATWNPVTSPTPGAYSAVWGPSAASVYLLGGGGVWNTTTGGVSFTQVTTPPPLFVEPVALHGAGGSLYAVGQGGLIWRPSGGGLDVATIGATDEDFTGIWGLSLDDYFVAGSRGNVTRFSVVDGGSVVTPMSLPRPPLNGLFGLKDMFGVHVYAPGAGGDLYHFTDYPSPLWSADVMGAGGALKGVWGSSSSDVYAVGEHGLILHTLPTMFEWAPQDGGTAETLNGVWGSSGSDVWVFGDNATLLRGTGAGTWSKIALSGAASLTAAWGSGPNDVFVGDSMGHVFHWNGGVWTSAEAAPSRITAIIGIDGGALLAATVSGSVVLGWDAGATWAPTQVSASNGLNAFCAFPGDALYVVGGGGAMLRKR